VIAKECAVMQELEEFFGRDARNNTPGEKS